MELCALPTLFHFRWTSNLRKEARQFLWKKEENFQIYSHAVHLFCSHNMCLLLRITESLSDNTSAWSVWSQRGQWKMLFVKRKIRKCSRLSHRNIHTSVPTRLTICLKMKHWSRQLRRLHFYHRKYKFIKKWINDIWIFNSECCLYCLSVKMFLLRGVALLTLIRNASQWTCGLSLSFRGWARQSDSSVKLSIALYSPGGDPLTGAYALLWSGFGSPWQHVCSRPTLSKVSAGTSRRAEHTWGCVPIFIVTAAAETGPSFRHECAAFHLVTQQCLHRSAFNSKVKTDKAFLNVTYEYSYAVNDILLKRNYLFNCA